MSPFWLGLRILSVNSLLQCNTVQLDKSKKLFISGIQAESHKTNMILNFLLYKFIQFYFIINTYKSKTITDWISDAAFIIKYLHFSNVHADSSSFVATVRCITKVIYLFVLLTKLQRTQENTYCTVIVSVPSIRVVAASRPPPGG
jgi:hypothetical protein